MRIVLLGTGDAVGTPKIGCKCAACLDAMPGSKSRRFRPCILVTDGTINVLLETGPDLRSQLLDNDVSRIDAVVWSHSHRDHTGGFGDFWRVKNDMPVYGEKRVMDPVLAEFHFLTFKRHDRELYEPFTIGELEFTLFEVTHPPIDLATGMRIRHNGKTAIYTGDTNLQIPEKSLALMQDADLLIADAIVPPHIRIDKHMNAGDAMKLAGQLGAKETVLIHLAHLYPPHGEASKNYPLGYDGQVIEL